jgi:hypothetical protein
MTRSNGRLSQRRKKPSEESLVGSTAFAEKISRA